MDSYANGLARSNQQAFALFYDTYSPRLWGIILLAKLPAAQAETILINTFKKAWQPLGQHTLRVELTFPDLLTIAYGEGLSREHLQNSLLPKLTKTRMNATQPSWGKSMNVLIIGCSPDDQAVITQSLKVRMSQAKPIFASGTDQSLHLLGTSSAHTNQFPRLLVLTLSVADEQTDWQFLQQVRARYRQLPIVIIGAHHQAHLALTAYDLGINSFLIKSSDLGEWKIQLTSLSEYWFEIVTLPN
jgi:CheY-like chemotaxis protein